MASFVPTSKETLEEQRLYTEERMVEVACLDCLATVLVKKNSDHQTSVQWTSEGRSHCHELQRRSRETGGRDMHKPCSRLMTSIDAAVRDGNVSVGAVDGY
ncbi:MAG TPA: hypothetical protein VJ872_00655 [Nocardioides sp.]|nr:hypothetical protein [Nocardioides sp.]